MKGWHPDLSFRCGRTQAGPRFVLPSRIGKLVQHGSSTALGVEYVGLKLNKAIHVLLQAPDRTAIGSGKPRK